MNIKLFDKRYVYLEWSDVLEEKDCILAKTYQDLKDFVDTSEEDRFVKVNKGKVKPFTNLWSECDFCYYDPNLKVKKAWLEGKTIQKRVLNEWKDFTKSSCNIEWDAYDWRIKPSETKEWYITMKKFYNAFMLSTKIYDKYVFYHGTEKECNEWIKEHQSMRDIMRAWLNGEIIQFYDKDEKMWITVKVPIWDKDLKYRVKPTETWYVIFNEDNFLRVRIIDNLSNTVFFNGTYKECGKWIDEHKLYAEIISAWKHGKIIQYKIKTDDWYGWSDWFLEEYPNTDSFERCDWRIKPTIKENEKYTMLCDNKYILDMYKNGCFNFSISKYCVNNPIYFGDKEKCMRVMNEVNGNFIHNNEKCVECNGLYCHKCEELKKFINDVKFTRRMTNREVAKWLAEGKGEVKVNDTLYPSCYYTYIIGSENIEVGQGTFIREWDSDEWKEPLIEMEQ